MTLAGFHPPVQAWFQANFAAPTPIQVRAWEALARRENALCLAPTGSGKTLAAFLVAIERLMFTPPGPNRGRILYVSPIKALAVDVERNLRAPLAGIAAAASQGVAEVYVPRVAVRSGDTPPRERELQRKYPPDIWITTPESLYLLLASRAREALRDVDTIIIDEIHALVTSKRGVHLALSIERLEALRREQDSACQPLQRIGLSATQRPLSEVARFLGGYAQDEGGEWQPRPVTIVDASEKPALQLTVEMPLEVLQEDGWEEAALVGAGMRSLWQGVVPRLVDIIAGHRTTMIFVNNRRLAERLCAAINERAGQAICRAHHGSVAREQRMVIEDQLKRGELAAVIATASMELGVDLGTVDLVVQIEAPPSVAAGIQRIGRSSHHVGGRPQGIIFPKYRGDLLACAAACAAMQSGVIEASAYPRLPLDVLAQQVAAMCAATESLQVDEVERLVRGAAPYHELSRPLLHNVLDLLAGRFVSHDFAGIAPKVNWDRITGTLSARPGARLAVLSQPGTIPDRGLFPVFLDTGAEGKRIRVGELDEEMIVESREGEIFVLGASSWKITAIKTDRILVVPAPGQPGKMPFWRAESAARSGDLGRAIGALSREVLSVPRPAALAKLQSDHALTAPTAEVLIDYLESQRAATTVVPDDQTIVVETFADEIGDLRLLVLSPLGSRLHAPWAMCIAVRLQQELGVKPDVNWFDDGMVFRIPEPQRPVDMAWLVPDTETLEEVLTQELTRTSLFAAHFRENAGRALLLPRKQPGQRLPRWMQRRRSAELLAAAAEHPSFPIVLETVRECMREVFDVGGLREILQRLSNRTMRLVHCERDRPSPFASALLFNYVANFVYEGDAPLAERRAQVLALDDALLRELIGATQWHTVLDPEVVAQVSAQLERRGEEQRVRDRSGLHHLLLQVGPLTVSQIEERMAPGGAASAWLVELQATAQALRCRLGGRDVWAAAEDAARLRDGLGVVLPPGLPSSLLEPAHDPLRDLIRRFCKTHGPFVTDDVVAALGLSADVAQRELDHLVQSGRLVRGLFVGGAGDQQFCDAQALKRIKQACLSRAREAVEPVDLPVYVRFLLQWQGVGGSLHGLPGLFEALVQLQGLPLPISILESEILAQRVRDYQPSWLDTLLARGDLVWRGVSPLGRDDGRIAFFLREHAHLLGSKAAPIESELAARIRQHLAARGSVFFSDLQRALAIFPQELADTLWQMVWSGELTNDSFEPLRALTRDDQAREQRSMLAWRRVGFHGRVQPRATQGSWRLVAVESAVEPTERALAWAEQLVHRFGLVGREVLQAEALAPPSADIRAVLSEMEQSGRVRRGHFVQGLSPGLYAMPGADERLRQGQRDGESEQTLVLSACDPALPYGYLVGWPTSAAHDVKSNRLQRTPGARVFLSQGRLLAYLNRGGDHLITWPSDDEAQDRVDRDLVVAALVSEAIRRRGLLLETVDLATVGATLWAPLLCARGFVAAGTACLWRAKGR